MYATIALLVVVATAHGAVRYQPFVEKPAEFADQDGCYIPELGKVLPYEQPHRPAGGEPCAIYLCRANNETQIDTCGNAVVPDGCRLVKPAPGRRTADNCCGDVVCDNIPE